MSFEDFLESLGYVRHVPGPKNTGLVVDKSPRGSYSTYGPLFYTFIKDGVRIQYGLLEAGRPPTLCLWPDCRPIDLELHAMRTKHMQEYFAFRRGKGPVPTPMEWWDRGNTHSDRIMSRYPYEAIEEAIRCKTTLI